MKELLWLLLIIPIMFYNTITIAQVRVAVVDPLTKRGYHNHTKKDLRKKKKGYIYRLGDVILDPETGKFFLHAGGWKKNTRGKRWDSKKWSKKQHRFKKIKRSKSKSPAKLPQRRNVPIKRDKSLS